MYNNICTYVQQLQNQDQALTKAVKNHYCHYKHRTGVSSFPELFNMFVNNLSIGIAELDNISVPHLNGFPVSHLLWADYLILLALDNQSLQA